MSGGDGEDPLEGLGRRLEAAQQSRRQERREEAPDGSSGQAMAAGLRLGLELVVAVCVGVGLGWAFDKWLGTSPWGLIGFLFLGFAAGVSNVIRTALRIERAVGFRSPSDGPGRPGNEG